MAQDRIAVRIDGFKDEDAAPFVGYEPRSSARFWSRVDALRRWLDAEVLGIENLPRGRALIVMNHAFGWDAMLPMAAIRQRTGRRVWALGEHAWWKFPFLRKLAANVGTVDGTPENVDRLLSANELVLVLPGGLRESMKPRELRYRLIWGKRFGFVRAAMRNRAPLVPLAAIGSDEVFDLVGDPFARGKRLLGVDFPLPRPAWGLPIVHRSHLRYVVGEPIETAPRPGEEEETAVRRVRREIRGAIEEILDEELAARAGFGA